jgi:16S rRNA (cytidine1402-2'-O)-methyltransferase
LSGKLYLVPTPIGNLGDLTYRAADVLRSCDAVLAEDTRVSARLLQHYEIRTPLESFHQYNEHKRLENVLQRLEKGAVLCLVSDAGTPGISDPGFLLARACRERGIACECLPGATAFVPALVQSGFPIHSFVFHGFLPQKKGRDKMLRQLLSDERTQVLYESPYRLLKLLEALQTLAPERPVSVSRELSKLHEETRNGLPHELADHYRKQVPKGEIVVVIASLAVLRTDQAEEEEEDTRP